MTDITQNWDEKKKEQFYEDAQNYSLREMAKLYGIAKTTVRQIKIRWNVPEMTPEAKKRIQNKIADASREGFRNMSDEDRERMFSNATQSIREQVAKERRRVIFGIPQQTNRRITLNTKQARQRAMAKARMVHRNGYISTGIDSRILLYDENTKRSLYLEDKNNKRYRIITRPVEGFDDANSKFVKANGRTYT